ncbi:MAG: NAD-dependent deacylase [bacterium]
MAEVADKIARTAQMIVESESTVALTGAGISTPSGIPDFRSPGSGLWEKVDPMEVATIYAFRANPGAFYRFMAPMSELVRDAKPNDAHIALSELESMNFLKSVITQNIDNLHQRAGSKNVIELHGNGERAYCLSCKKKYTRDEAASLVRQDEVPRCACGGLIKPDVILFGEQLPVHALLQAQSDAEGCSLMLIIGSSLTVAPASMLPQIAVRYGAKVIIINLQPTYMDNYAELTMNDKVEVILPAIVEKVKEMRMN